MIYSDPVGYHDISDVPQNLALETTLAALSAKVIACNTGAVTIAGGTVTANIGTIGGIATEITLSSLNSKVTACNTGAVTVSNYPGPLAAQLPAALVSGRLDVNIGASAGLTATVSGSVTANAGTNLNTSALALETTLSSLNGKVTAVNTGAVVISSGTVTANLGTIAGVATETTLASLNSKVTACNTGAVVISSGTVTANAGTGTFTTADNQSISDNAAFTDGTSKVFISGYIFDEVAGTALTENDAAAARVDSKRAQVFTLEDATTRGQRLTVSAAGAAKVDGSAVTQPISGSVTANLGTIAGVATETTLSSLNSKVTACNTGAVVVSSGTITANLGTIAGVATETTLSSLNGKVTACNTGAVVLAAGAANIGSIASILTSIVPGTAATNLGKAEDAAHTTGDVGVFALGIRNDANASLTNNDLDYSGISVDAAGNPQVDILTSALPAGAATSANQTTIITSVQLIDDVVHAAAGTLSKSAAIGGVLDDVSPGNGTEGAVDAARINKTRTLGAGPILLQTADLATVNTTYNNVTTTATGSDVDCDGYAFFSLGFTLVSASTPTDIQFIIEFKDADGNYMAFQDTFWARFKIEDTEVSASKNYCFWGRVLPGSRAMRLRVVATGTDASKTFTLSEAKIGLSTI